MVQNDRFVGAASVLDLLVDEELPGLTRAFFAHRMPDPARGPVSPEQIRLAMDSLWREVTLPRMTGCSVELVSLCIPCRALVPSRNGGGGTDAHNVDGTATPPSADDDEEEETADDKHAGESLQGVSPPSCRVAC